MKLLRRNKTSFVFQLNAAEKDILSDTLNMYPLVPAHHHRLTRSIAAETAEHQRLLEESLAEQRAENRRQVQALFDATSRWRPVGENYQLSLKPAEIDWLLQVLNDVRVGCWLELGEPDEDKPPQITGANIRQAIALEVCGAFESVLLAALGETESPDWAK